MGKPYHIWSYWRYLVLQKRPQLFQPSQCSLNDQNRVFHFLLTWPQSEVSPVGHFLSFLHSTSQCSTALQSAALPCTVQQSANMSKPSSVQYSTVHCSTVQHSMAVSCSDHSPGPTLPGLQADMDWCYYHSWYTKHVPRVQYLLTEMAQI